MDFKGAVIELKRNKHLLTKQQWRTLKGQIMNGDKKGAIKGLKKIKARLEAGSDS